MLVNKAEQTSCLSLKIQPKHPVVLVFSPSKSKWQNTAPGNHKLAATEMSLEWRMTTLTAHACITKWGVCVWVCVGACACVCVGVWVCVGACACVCVCVGVCGCAWLNQSDCPKPHSCPGYPRTLSRVPCAVRTLGF